MGEVAKRKIWFARNESAEQLESEGKLQEALKLYEENAAEGCDIAYTYERMAALYRSQKRFDDEVNALETALAIEQKRGPTGQMLRLQKRIETAEEVRKREGPRGAPTIREASEDTRQKPIKKKQKKGCLGVLVFAVASGGLMAALIL